MIPLVSVVMPSFNQAEFLEEAVESVFAQDVERLELVVMDGGSSDGSQRVLAKLASAHAGRLRWHSAPDAGPASAINRAVEAAHAPVIGWLNSDDLYAPGAVSRALARFAAAPETVMVYGEGEHVDVGGRFIERDPTLPPETPRAAWADGCPVCQPTVFFRRDAFLALGGLDTSLRASFDYEFWLRLMAAHPGRTGFVDAVQARTRMHAGTITSRFRERVALEGLQVVSRHLGMAPAHWMLTHFTELAQGHPFDATDGATLEARCRAAMAHAAPWLLPETVARLDEAIAADARIRLSDAGFSVGVDADGWVRDVLELRLQQPADAPVGLIVLHGEHVLPLAGPLVFEVVSPDALVQSFELLQPGPFRVEIPVADRSPGARLVWRLTTHTTIAPASLYGNDDERPLAFRLTGVALEAS
jgi:hypothetical protein